MGTAQFPGIKKMSPGKSFITFCVVRNKEIKFKQNGEPYLELELGDPSGRLKARIWERVDELNARTRIGGIVKIQAFVQTYNQRKELKIQKLREASEEDQVSLEQLLPASKTHMEQLKKDFQAHRESIQNKYLRRLLSAVFQDSSLAEAYYRSPAGKLWHHNYLYGMLEHVVAMLELAEVLKKHYPSIDLDLLKTGIICHDLGKVREYSLNGFIDFSTEGRLIGHAVTSFHLLEKKIEMIEDFPETLRNQLQHMVLSHPGKDNTAPVVPMTLEAMVLQHLIQLDAYTNALVRILEYDALPGAEWTKYIPLLDRFIYTASGKSGEEMEQ